MTWFHQQSIQQCYTLDAECLLGLTEVLLGLMELTRGRTHREILGSLNVCPWRELYETLSFSSLEMKARYLCILKKPLYYWVTSTTQIKQIEIKLTVKELFLKSIFWNQRIHCCRPLWEIERKTLKLIHYRIV